MAYRIMADMILVIHASFVAFVILGFILIIFGALRPWAWVRNMWFRLIHLLSIGVVVLEAWVGGICPLTEWENRLREAAGGVGYKGSFISHWLHELMFYDADPEIFRALYTGFGMLVVLVWIFVPPRRMRR